MITLQNNENEMKNAESLLPTQTTALLFAKTFAESYIDVFRAAQVPLQLSSSIYFLSHAQTAHTISSMIDFTGAINGFMMINYPEESAIDVVSCYHESMGLPAEESPESLGVELIDTLGEILNQASGIFRKNLENRYEIKTKSFTPVTMIVNNRLTLRPADAGNEYNYIRLQLTTPKSNGFFIEFCVQESMIITSESIKVSTQTTEEILKEGRENLSSKKSSDSLTKNEELKEKEKNETEDLLNNLFG